MTQIYTFSAQTVIKKKKMNINSFLSTNRGGVEVMDISGEGEGFWARGFVGQVHRR